MNRKEQKLSIKKKKQKIRNNLKGKIVENKGIEVETEKPINKTQNINLNDMNTIEDGKQEEQAEGNKKSVGGTANK